MLLLNRTLIKMAKGLWGWIVGIAALKMVTDMERIGDHASDIAALVVEISGSPIFHIVEHIPFFHQK